MLDIDDLEMDIAYACNLKCVGCTHYSNYGLGGIVDFEQGSVWLKAWAERLKPATFSILGGEPMLNPRVCEYITLCRKLWPETKLAVVSNGFLLDRAPALMETLAATGTDIIISYHSGLPEYTNRVQQQLLRLASSPYTEKVTLNVRNSAPFYDTYRGTGADMLPYEDGNPAKSWEVCHNKDCRTIHQGLLWKCPPIAFLEMVARKFDLHEKPQWQRYLEYRGIGPDVSDDELQEYLDRKEEYICEMCPNRLVYHDALPDWSG